MYCVGQVPLHKSSYYMRHTCVVPHPVGVKLKSMSFSPSLAIGSSGTSGSKGMSRRHKEARGRTPCHKDPQAGPLLEKHELRKGTCYSYKLGKQTEHGAWGGLVVAVLVAMGAIPSNHH